MRKMKPTNVVMFIFLLAGLLNAQIWNEIMGHEGDYFNKEQFKKALGQATTTVSHTSRIELQSGTLKGHAGVEEVSTEATQGSWRVSLTSWQNLAGDEVNVSYAPAIIMNYGNRFEYAFFSPDLPDKFFDEIVGKLADLKENMTVEYDDMNVEWGRHENKITVTAVYPYTGGVDEGDIDERLVYLMNECRTLMYKSLPIIKDYKDDYQDMLMDSKLEYLSREALLGIIGEWMAQFESENADVPEGYYSYTTSGTYNFEIYNYGEDYYLTQWINLPFEASAEQSNEILARLQAYLADEGVPEGASEAYVKWYPGYEGSAVLVQSIFKFDGTYTGEDFSGYERDCREKFMTKIYDEMIDICEDYE